GADPVRLLRLWQKHAPSAPGPRYLFLDELQEAKDWRASARELAAADPDLRLAGIVTHVRDWEKDRMTGRFVCRDGCRVFAVEPLSFWEYLKLRGELDEGLAGDPAKALPEAAPVPSALHELFEWSRKDLAACQALAARLAGPFDEYLARGGFPKAALAKDLDEARRIVREEVVAGALAGMTRAGRLRAPEKMARLLRLIGADEGGEPLCSLLKVAGLAGTTGAKYFAMLQAAGLVREVENLDALRGLRAWADSRRPQLPQGLAAIGLPVSWPDSGRTARLERIVPSFAPDPGRYDGIFPPSLAWTDEAGDGPEAVLEEQAGDTARSCPADPSLAFLSVTAARPGKRKSASRAAVMSIAVRAAVCRHFLENPGFFEEPPALRLESACPAERNPQGTRLCFAEGQCLAGVSAGQVAPFPPVAFSGRRAPFDGPDSLVQCMREEGLARACAVTMAPEHMGPVPVSSLFAACAEPADERGWWAHTARDTDLPPASQCAVMRIPASLFCYWLGRPNRA
ncbi:MAG: hypothetical protein Q4F72_07890, partial [Desulfovibrionaceae bacterium]|nr:hypothetical protein [Desulfovibrionaceae bacterium]